MGYFLRFVLAVCTLAFFAPFFAMFAEPFFLGALSYWGIDTSRWAAPVMTFLGDLVSQSWFQWLGFTVIGATIGAWADWAIRRWERNRARIPLATTPYDANLYSYDAPQDAPDTEIYYALTDFSVSYLIPACTSLLAIQEALIERLIGNPTIARFAIDGMETSPSHELRPFWKNYGNIIHGVDSCDPWIKWDALVDCIKTLERTGYRALRKQVDEIAESAGIELRNDTQISPLWRDWSDKHIALVNEYNKVKSNPRYGKRLFKPLQESRWGEISGSAQVMLIDTKASAADSSQTLEEEGGSKLPSR